REQRPADRARPSAALLGRLQDRHALQVLGHREEVEGADEARHVPGLLEVPQVAGERRRVAGDVRDTAGAEAGDMPHGALAGAGARWVKYHDVGLCDAGAGQHGVDLALLDPHPVEVAEVVPRVLDRALGRLDAQHGTTLPRALAPAARLAAALRLADPV